MPDEILPLSEESHYEGLDSLPILAQEAQQAGLSATLVLRDCKSEDAARRRHDIAAALRTLHLTIDALKDGYQFDDPMAGAKIRAIEKAVGILNRESEGWRQLLPNN